ncbi:MAG: 4Fe-4S dicluster domain-containing protein [Candidatus Edwardsbacteria bacterium]
MKGKVVRKFVQVLFLIVFLLSLFEALWEGTSPSPILGGLKLLPSVLQLDPFISFLNRGLPIWAIGLLVLTIILGRFFCGWVCPLGTLLDFFPLYKIQKEMTSPCSSPTPPLFPPPVGEGKGGVNFKYYLLLFLLIASLFSWQVYYVFDPLVIFSKVFFLSYSFQLSAFVFLSLIFILLFLNFLTSRFWCRFICPLGALLGIFSQWKLLKLQIDESCPPCEKCVNLCPTGAISLPVSSACWHNGQGAKSLKVKPAECILCLKCSSACPSGMIHWGFFKNKTHQAELDLKRRYLLGTLVGGGLLALGIRKSGIFSTRGESFGRWKNARLLRPPGSLLEEEFVKRCIRCGACMGVCPNKALYPSILEGGISGFWSPRLIPVLGYCEEFCTLCGQVCPTQAIKRFSQEEKRNLKIGQAVLNQSRCLSWSKRQLCLICYEFCSYQAIGIDKQGRPYVKSEACVGCGSCEHHCPVEWFGYAHHKGERAICVFSVS